jgi:Protein of unknown function (DUF3808)
MFLWNLFKITGKNFNLANGVYKIIDKSMIALESSGPNDPIRKFETDNRALLLLLRGAVLRHMNSPLQAKACLDEVISMQKVISPSEKFLIPYAIVEMAFIHIEENSVDLAIGCLEDAKKNYSGYSLESRLHFRIHTALTDLKAQKELNE